MSLYWKDTYQMYTNGSISYVSPTYVGSTSDVELTHICGFFLEKLEGKHGISVMADRGFTIEDMLNDIGVELPFLEGRSQLSQEDIKKTCHIASLHKNVIVTFAILQENLLSMSHLVNQIVCVLTNFHPAILQSPVANSGTDVDYYFQSLASDSETETGIGASDMEL